MGTPALSLLLSGAARAAANRHRPRRSPAWLNRSVRAWWRTRAGRALAGVLIVAPVVAAALAGPAPPPGLSAVPAGPGNGGLRMPAWGGLLVDAGTGVPLWARDAGVARPMGSITKVIAALVVLQAGDLNREIRVTPGAIR